MALAKVASVEAVDRDPLRCWMTARNAGCRTLDQDVTDIALDDRFLHIDPARRDEASGRRSWNPQNHQPAWPVLAEMISRAKGAACTYAHSEEEIGLPILQTGGETFEPHQAVVVR